MGWGLTTSLGGWCGWCVVSAVLSFSPALRSLHDSGPGCSGSIDLPTSCPSLSPPSPMAIWLSIIAMPALARPSAFLRPKAAQQAGGRRRGFFALAPGFSLCVRYNLHCAMPIQEFQVNSFGILIQKIADPRLLLVRKISAGVSMDSGVCKSRYGLSCFDLRF